jgi:ribosomal protein S18 acetylase RimI-like enzyme
MGDVRVRRVRPGDVEEHRRVRLAMLQDVPDAFASRYEDEAAEPPEFWEERARLAAASPQVATFIAESDGVVVGSATGLRFDPANPADLVAMGVDPAWRRRGIGGLLVEAVCRWAGRRGSRAIDLDVRELNTAALDLYRRCGFSVVAGPHPATAAPHLMEFRMRRPLDVPPPGPVVERLRREGVPVERLERLSGPDLRSLLLHLTRRRAATRVPAELLGSRRNDVTLSPAPQVDAAAMADAEVLAFRAAAGFEPVTLPPIAPTGINTVLGGIDQNLSLATVRGGEVLADPTTSLALEAALRRRDGDRAPALCWAGRVLRMQHFGGGWNQHFGLFALVSAGRRLPGDGFAMEALRAHLTVHLELMSALAAAGHDPGTIAVEVSDTAVVRALCRGVGVDPDDLIDQARTGDAAPEQLLAEAGVAVERFSETVDGFGDRAGRLQRVEQAVFAPLRERFPDVVMGFRVGRLAAAGYYNGLMVNVDIEHDGERLSVADGGSVDWTQRLLSDRAERLFVSGIGIERLVRRGA